MNKVESEHGGKIFTFCTHLEPSPLGLVGAEGALQY